MGADWGSNRKPIYTKAAAPLVERWYRLRDVGNFCTVDTDLANDLVWHGMPIVSIVRWSAIMPIGDQAT